MKILPLALVCIALMSSHCIYAQTADSARPSKKNKTLHVPGEFWNQYDRFTDETAVLVGLFTLEDMTSQLSSGGSVKFAAGFFYSGQVLRETPTKFYFLFTSQSKEWEFLKRHKLLILADGERFNLGDGGQDREVKVGGVQEFLAFPMSKEDFEKLTKAKKIEMRLGDYETALTDYHLSALRELLEASIPEAH